MNARDSLIALLSSLLLPALLEAQSLTFTRIEAIAGGVRLNFTDSGSGMTDYALEFTPALAPGPDWFHDTDAVLSPIGGGLYEMLTPTSLALAFYRVVAFNSSQPTTANFTTPSLEVQESNGSLRLTFQFSAPFHGVVNYTVGGTIGPGDLQPLSGSVVVNGTTASILVTLNENTSISQLKYLTLTLQPGSGFRVGPRGQATINILENDAKWQGTFFTDNASLGFSLKIAQSGSSFASALSSERLGFFPTNEIPTALTFTDNAFFAAVENVPINANATLLNLPMNLAFTLSAINVPTNQNVSPTLVEGLATLVTQVPGKPFLNTTNHGTFVLIKPPVAPSTNEVQLVTAP
jgi:hypothetical protein